jgi:hypothetical protein
LDIGHLHAGVYRIEVNPWENDEWIFYGDQDIVSYEYSLPRDDKPNHNYPYICANLNSSDYERLELD